MAKAPKKTNPERAMLAAYEAAITAMDEGMNAFRAIPPNRQDPELRACVDMYANHRNSIQANFNRTKERRG